MPAADARIVRSNRRRVRRFFAGLLVAIGVFDVYGAVAAHDPLRDLELQSLVPTAVSLGGRTALVIAGLSLLLLARGMARGKRVAWQLTCGVLGLSALLHLVKGLDLEGAVTAVWLLLGLWWLREYFQAESDPVALIRGALTLAGGTALAAFYSLAGSWLLRHQLQPGFAVERTLQRLSAGVFHTTFDYQPTTLRATWFLATLPWVAGTLVLIGLVQLLRPALAPVTDRADRDRLRALLAQVAMNPVSYLSLSPGISHFWAAEDAAVPYRLTGRLALVLGDPVAPPHRLAAAVEAFTAYCDAQDWTAAFYQVEGRSPYAALGHVLVPVGADAVVDVAAFSLEGKEKADLRYAHRRCLREGITVRFMPGAQALSEAGDEIRELSSRWLAGDRGPELAFSLGTTASLGDDQVTAGLARSPGGRLEAIVSLLPARAGTAWTLDLMRRQPDAPYGVMEALLVESIAEAARRGMSQFSLGLAPRALDRHVQPETRRVVRAAYAGLSRFQRTGSLQHFKAKFTPRWETRYLAVEETSLLPEAALAVLRAHLPPLRRLMLRIPLALARLAAGGSRAGAHRRATATP